MHGFACSFTLIYICSLGHIHTCMHTHTVTLTHTQWHTWNDTHMEWHTTSTTWYDDIGWSRHVAVWLYVVCMISRGCLFKSHPIKFLHFSSYLIVHCPTYWLPQCKIDFPRAYRSWASYWVSDLILICCSSMRSLTSACASNAGANQLCWCLVPQFDTQSYFRQNTRFDHL